MTSLYLNYLFKGLISPNMHRFWHIESRTSTCESGGDTVQSIIGLLAARLFVDFSPAYNEWMNEQMKTSGTISCDRCYVSSGHSGFFWSHRVKRGYLRRWGAFQAGKGVGSQQPPPPQITNCSPGTCVRKSAGSECQLVGREGTLSGSVCHLLRPHWNLAIIWWKHFAHFQENFPLSVRLFSMLRLSPEAFRAAILLSPWKVCVSWG